MIARLLGMIIVLVPVSVILGLFIYWLRRKNRRDLIEESKLKE